MPSFHEWTRTRLTELFQVPVRAIRRLWANALVTHGAPRADGRGRSRLPIVMRWRRPTGTRRAGSCTPSEEIFTIDAESRRIWEMFGRLSEAFWDRVREPGVSALDVLSAEQHGPVSEEEKAIWAEITAPHNYASLRLYIEGWQKVGMNDHAARLYEMLLTESTRRWEMEFGGNQ